MRPDAVRRIRNFLLIEELGRAEGIVVEDSAVQAEVERIVSEQAEENRDTARRDLSTNEMQERVRSNLQVKMLLDRLIAIVTEGQTPIAPGDAAPAAAEAAPAADAPAAPEADKPKLIIATH